MNTTTQTTYTVSIRYWFDKAGGNTYFTAKAYGSDGSEITVPFQYGHGELTVKYEIARLLGIDYASLDWEQRRAIFPHVDEVTVSSKKQLHQA